MSAITISTDDFSKLSIDTQNEIINRLFPSKNNTTQLDDSEGELTKKQVNEIISKLSDKSKGVLRAAASFKSNSINFDELLEKLDTDAEDIKGVWSGLTTRCRNVTGDSEFRLIEWIWNEEEEYHTMKFHPTTYTHITSFFQ